MDKINATHCVVLDKDGDIKFSICLKSCMAINAKQFCNDHINDAIADKIEGSNKWAVRFLNTLLVLQDLKNIELKKESK